MLAQVPAVLLALLAICNVAIAECDTTIDDVTVLKNSRIVSTEQVLDPKILSSIEDEVKSRFQSSG